MAYGPLLFSVPAFKSAVALKVMMLQSIFCKNNAGKNTFYWKGVSDIEKRKPYCVFDTITYMNMIIFWYYPFLVVYRSSFEYVNKASINVLHCTMQCILQDPLSTPWLIIVLLQFHFANDVLLQVFFFWAISWKCTNFVYVTQV